MGAKIAFAGNSACGDDGIGPAIYRRLRDSGMLPDCELIDLGVAGLGLMEYATEGERLIIVDAVRADKRPGLVKVFSEQEIENLDRILTQHDLGVGQAAMFARLYIPDIRSIHLVGISTRQPGTLSDCFSPEISAAFEKIYSDVCQKIGEILQGLHDKA